MFKKIAMSRPFQIAAAVGAAVATAVPSFAAGTLDFTGMTTAITAELSPAVTAAMPIAGVILAAGVGIKLYKRFAK